jgi:hypothetical protein
MKKLSNLMLLANFISTLFYSLSYPYIYAETVKVVPHLYISVEQILACLGTIVFCRLWNKHSDKLFTKYHVILGLEIIADIILFADVLIRHNLSFYFLLNVIIFALITKNVACGGTKMRARVHPTEKLREQYDNNSNIACSIATLLGAGIAIISNMNLWLLFIFAFIGNAADNAFYLYIYYKLRGTTKNESKLQK